MTGRRTRREIARTVEQLEDDGQRADAPEFGRPDPLTDREREALRRWFDVDPEDVYGPSSDDTPARLHRRFS
jgi:hypothetical protein